MAVKTFDASKAREYPAYTLYPFHHATGPMPWAAASVVDLSKADRILFLSGQTGRDPEHDPSPTSFEHERSMTRVVAPDVKSQTTAAWQRIKETLDGLDARLEDIVFIRYMLTFHDDYWDMREATMEFWKKYAPDLAEHRRAATLFRQVGLALTEMRVEIEVIAVTAKKKG